MLEEICSRIKVSISELCDTYEIILIDDYSSDNSWDLICQIVKRSSNIKGIKLSRNFGQHNAIMAGLKEATGDYIITMDDDGQNPPEEIHKLVNAIKLSDSDLVYGVYNTKAHELYRNYGSKIVQWVFRRIFKNKGDIGAFRIFKASLNDKIKHQNTGYIFLDGLLHWHTANVDYTYVEHHKRKIGSSGYNLLKLISLAANLIFNFTTFPLRFLTFTGVLTSIISFILGLIYIYRRYFIDDVPIGFTAQIVSIFFLASAIMLGFAVVGVYLSRIYSIQNKAPGYSVEKKA